MRRSKILPALVIAIAMLLTIAMQGSAAAYPSNNVHYVALGDSIAYGGSGAPGDQWVEDSYADLLSKYFAAHSNKFEYHNLSTPGIDSTALLAQIKEPKWSSKGSIAMEIVKSDLITISIGGNNLLGPLYRYTSGVTTQDEFYEDLSVNIAKFEQDWPNILKEIRKANPTAKIAVMTVYNPFQFMPEDQFGTNALWFLGNTYLPMINSVIKNNTLAAEYKYQAIDVYSAFEGKEFSEDLTFVYHVENSDPHPTEAGHQLIYTLHETYFDSLLKN